MGIWKSRYARNRARQAYNNWWRNKGNADRKDGHFAAATVQMERRWRCKECKNQDICGLYGKSDDPSCYEIVQRNENPRG